MTPKDRFSISIIGLGYVGLPLAGLFLQQGNTVYGIDLDTKKIDKLNEKRSYLSDLSDADVQNLFANGLFHPTSSFDPIAQSEVIILCVPTPLDAQAEPDLTYVRNAMQSALPHLRPGQLVVLESSTFPGTTEEILMPMVESTGLRVGQDIHLAYSPERIDPGQKQFALTEIPKVVGGITPRCTELAARVYGSVFQKVVTVSSAKVAELTKLLENCQRFVNISFMNELAMLCDEMKINLWEAVQAASTKPYGFTPYYPGPGVGGHCIPVDPLYLLWKAKEFDFSLHFIAYSHQINEEMSDFVIQKMQKHFPPQKELANARIFVLGVTYKKDVNDIRESSALRIIDKLLRSGSTVHFYDPYMDELDINGTKLKQTPMTPQELQSHDCTLILTDHSAVDYEAVVTHSPLVIDTRQATRQVSRRDNVILL